MQNLRKRRTASVLECGIVAGLWAFGAACLRAQSPTEYRLSFPDAVHHVVDVDVIFHDVPPGPLWVQMSRSSPGRYAAFDFAENEFDEHFRDGAGKPLASSRPNPRSWKITRHDGTVHIDYQLFGDSVDGTFAAIDTTHAHLNLPAVLMWAEGFDSRPVRVTFVPPAGSGWQAATQLYPTADSMTFSAPNFQYLMDSPVELSHFAVRTFGVPPLQAGGKTETVRVVVHSNGSEADLDKHVAGVQKIVQEEQAIFGELPDYETGTYTFLSDYLPWANGDGMEHRNSSVLTDRQELRDPDQLNSVAHEFIHGWNVKRIRPASLEPFNFADENMSGELWLAEGFTQYYGKLAMLRSGFRPTSAALASYARLIDLVQSAPGLRFRSAVDMSRLAPFVDGASDATPTYWDNTYTSYYLIGDLIALELDLTLRARTDSRVSLDDFMQAMWRVHGKPGGPAPGLVARPYTMADVRARLAEASGDRKFADDFVGRYVEGTERLDLAPLLLRAGFLLRPMGNAGTLGEIRLEKKDGALRLAGPTIKDSPAYKAGLDLDDELLSVGGVTLAAPDDLAKALRGKKGGETVELRFKRRGHTEQASATLAADTALNLVPVEAAGGTLSDEQRRFRESWLGSKVHH